MYPKDFIAEEIKEDIPAKPSKEDVIAAMDSILTVPMHHDTLVKLTYEYFISQKIQFELDFLQECAKELDQINHPEKYSVVSVDILNPEIVK